MRKRKTADLQKELEDYSENDSELSVSSEDNPQNII